VIEGKTPETVMALVLKGQSSGLYIYLYKIMVELAGNY
jgi:hypothetical protein